MGGEFTGRHVEDASQRSPVQDVATVVQHDTIAEHGINGTQPAAPAGIVKKGNRQILDKLNVGRLVCSYAVIVL